MAQHFPPVLLLDDDPVIVRMYAAAVNQMGLNAIIAETVGEAIPLVISEKPCLVISDLEMPGEGGVEFAKECAERGFKTMPFVFLTGHDNIETVRSGLDVGVDDFLIKGLPIEKIRNRIAFWTASGFKGLPSDIRRRAILYAKSLKGDQLPSIANVVEMDEAIAKTVERQMRFELDAVSDDFGERYIERVVYLGRLSKIIIDQCEHYGDFIRFPDVLYAVTQRLDMAWKLEITFNISEFETLCRDSRFAGAGMVPLQNFQDYD